MGNRNSASAEFYYSIEKIAETTGKCINSVVFTDSSISDNLMSTYSSLAKSTFKAFSENEKSNLINRTKTISNLFSKANFDEISSWIAAIDGNSIENEYFLPKLKYCAEVDRLNREFNATIKSLIELSDTFKKAQNFYDRK